MVTSSAIEQAFHEQRARLVGLAHRMLGSATEAEDAVQEVWIRVGRSRDTAIDNPGGWLTTVTARVCLNLLRARGARREELVEDWPDQTPTEGTDDPLHEAVLADAVGLALHVVLERLSPDERVAFVLHDLFAVPFEDIARIVDRSPAAARQLASRGRRRVQAGATVVRAAPDPHPSSKRALVDAFFAAARNGDLSGLLAVLHPDVVLTSDLGLTGELVLHGAESVAGQALMFANPVAVLTPVRVGDDVGVVVTAGDRVVSVMAFTVEDDRVAEVSVATDPDRLAALVP